MINFIRTSFDDPRIVKLIALLDNELKITDGDDHSFYNQYNGIQGINHFIIAIEEGNAVGCGAIKHHDDNAMEIKRMYVRQEARGKGLATAILNELENWALELSYKKCILETGLRQSSAIALYKKNGYVIIPNYDQYIGVDNSLCFEKELMTNK